MRWKRLFSFRLLLSLSTLKMVTISNSHDINNRSSIRTSLAVVAIISCYTCTRVLVDAVSTSSSILTWVGTTIVDIYWQTNNIFNTV